MFIALFVTSNNLDSKTSCRLDTVSLCGPSCCDCATDTASALLAPANLLIMEQQLLTYTVLGIGPYKLHQLHTSGGKVGVVYTCESDDSIAHRPN